MAASLSSQVGEAQVGAAQVGNIPAAGGGGVGFTINPNAGHTAGAHTINVQYTGGAISPASMPITIQSGPGAVSAWVQDTPGANGTGHFTYTQAGVSGTPTVFLDSVTSTTQSYSNAAVAPGAPTSPVITDNNNSTLTCTFVAPADNGGSAITGYTVTMSAGGGTDSNAGSTSLSHLITGVSLGISQFANVVASNVVGPGSSSANSNTLQPITLPGAPVSVTSLAGNALAIVSATPPVNDGFGGFAVASYIADDGTGGHTTSAGASPRTVVGLTNGITITPRAKFVNALGAGPFTSGNSVTPINTALMIVKPPLLDSDILGTVIAQTLTLGSVGPGPGISAVSSGGAPFTGPGQYILSGTGRGIITANSDSTHATITILEAFANTTIAPSAWQVWFPAYDQYTINAGVLTLTVAAVTTGWFPVQNITNSWELDAQGTPAADGSFAGIGLINGINGSQIAAFELNSPPVITPINLVTCVLSGWSPSRTLGTVVAQTLTLGSASPGTGISATAGGGNPFTGPGQYIFSGIGRAVVTSGSGNNAIVTVIDAFSTATPAPSAWQVGTPGYQTQIAGTLGSLTTAGIVAIPGIPNGFAARVVETPGANNGFQSLLVWSC